MGRGVSDNASFSHQLPSHFELRLHQNNNGPALAITSSLRKSCGNHCWQDQRCRNKRDIHHDEIDLFANLLGRQITRISFFQETNSRVLTQTRVDLAATGIHPYHAGSAALQQAIGETSRGNTNVEAHSPAYIDSPIIERSFQFETAPARVLQLFTKKSYGGVLIHCSA